MRKYKDLTDEELHALARNASTAEYIEIQREIQWRSRLDGLRTTCGVPRQYADLQLGSVEPAPHQELALKALSAIVEEGGGLYLYGKVGVGKSLLTAALVNALVEKGVQAKWMRWEWLMQDQKMRMDGWTSDQNMLDTARECRVLVLDDLGASKTSEWASSILVAILDARDDSGLQTIITSNLPPAAGKGSASLESAFGDRAASRVAKLCEPLRLAGPDLRKDPIE